MNNELKPGESFAFKASGHEFIVMVLDSGAVGIEPVPTGAERIGLTPQQEHFDVEVQDGRRVIYRLRQEPKPAELTGKYFALYQLA